MEELLEKEMAVESFGCNDCGADLKYKAGTTHLNCEYCGANNDIPQINGVIEELDFHEFLEKKISSEEVITASFVNCISCGASSTLENNITSSECPYCASPLVIDDVKDSEVIKPKLLLPFKIDKKVAKDEFKTWVNKLWFAPNDIKKSALNFDHFKGVYTPYWTFDTDTNSEYIGQRGVHYYETQTYTTTENGKSVTKTRQVKKTRWYTVQGNVNKFFDDILTVASNSLPAKHIYNLEPWDLENLVPFDKSYLSGFIAERYQIGLSDGFEIAKDIADSQIRSLIKSDIGGDDQRIISVNTNYNNITFKHILLPVYVCAFIYKEKLYRFLVNGRTGEIQGERPYSWIKISLAILTIIALILAIYLFAKYKNG